MRTLVLSPLRRQGAGDGTLEVIPLVAEAMAYVLLRPLCHDVPVHQFCGVNDTGGGDTLEITRLSFAVLDLALYSASSALALCLALPAVSVPSVNMLWACERAFVRRAPVEL